MNTDRSEPDIAIVALDEIHAVVNHNNRSLP
jgi:hypothetical protein